MALSAAARAQFFPGRQSVGSQRDAQELEVHDGSAPAVFLCLGGCVSNCAVSLCLGGCVSKCAVSRWLCVQLCCVSVSRWLCV